MPEPEGAKEEPWAAVARLCSEAVGVSATPEQAAMVRRIIVSSVGSLMSGQVAEQRKVAALEQLVGGVNALGAMAMVHLQREGVEPDEISQMIDAIARGPG